MAKVDLIVLVKEREPLSFLYFPTLLHLAHIWQFYTVFGQLVLLVVLLSILLTWQVDIFVKIEVGAASSVLNGRGIAYWSILVCSRYQLLVLVEAAQVAALRVILNLYLPCLIKVINLTKSSLIGVNSLCILFKLTQNVIYIYQNKLYHLPSWS